MPTTKKRRLWKIKVIQCPIRKFQMNNHNNSRLKRTRKRKHQLLNLHRRNMIKKSNNWKKQNRLNQLRINKTISRNRRRRTTNNLNKLLYLPRKTAIPMMSLKLPHKRPYLLSKPPNRSRKSPPNTPLTYRPRYSLLRWKHKNSNNRP